MARNRCNCCCRVTRDDVESARRTQRDGGVGGGREHTDEMEEERWFRDYLSKVHGS